MVSFASGCCALGRTVEPPVGPAVPLPLRGMERTLRAGNATNAPPGAASSPRTPCGCFAVALGCGACAAGASEQKLKQSMK